MEQMYQTGNALRVESRLRTMRMIWAAMLASVGVYVVVSVLLSPQEPDYSKNIELSEGLVFLPILFVASLVSIFLSFAIKKSLLVQASDKQNPGLVQTALIVALACCEAVAIFGLFCIMVTGNPFSYAFFALSAAAMALHFPRREHLLAASFRGGAGQGFSGGM